MIVYKFGGASVRSKAGVENLYRIVSTVSEPLFVVVSAMGKTTNALERVLAAWLGGEKPLEEFAAVETYHNEIAAELFAADTQALATFRSERLEPLLNEVHALLSERPRDDYDRSYDRLVGYGELLSTTIISAYLAWRGAPNAWIDMRDCFVTDSRYREANINVEKSTVRLHAAIAQTPHRLYVGQGFIGATASGSPTTLGREGSDYSAAMVASLLDAASVSIWKDVDGILNADPRLFSDTVFIPELTYLDAVELAYSGAQVIHPKTIKPLQNKQIPLYVRPFATPEKQGSVICGEITQPISVPILILKQNQVLISIRPKDFSFVLEERLADIFGVCSEYRQKINLIQSSAVNLSLCVDSSLNLERVVDRLQVDFRVVYNQGMELLTIRGYDEPTYTQYAEAERVFLVQKTRRTARIVRSAAE